MLCIVLLCLILLYRVLFARKIRMTWLQRLLYFFVYIGICILVNILRDSLFHFFISLSGLVLHTSWFTHATSPELPAPAVHVQPQQHAVQPVEPPQAAIPQQDDIWNALEEQQQPLMGYNERRAELDYKLSSFLLWTETQKSKAEIETIIKMQCEIDERLEKALSLSGYDDNFLLATRGEHKGEKGSKVQLPPLTEGLALLLPAWEGRGF